MFLNQKDECTGDFINTRETSKIRCTRAGVWMAEVWRREVNFLEFFAQLPSLKDSQIWADLTLCHRLVASQSLCVHGGRSMDYQ